jgi:hypothetical protein
MSKFLENIKEQNFLKIRIKGFPGLDGPLMRNNEK